MTPDLESSDLGSRPDRGTRLEVVIYRSTSPPTIFGAYRPSQKAKLCLRSRKEPWKILNIRYKCFIVAWRNKEVRLAMYIVYRFTERL